MGKKEKIIGPPPESPEPENPTDWGEKLNAVLELVRNNFPSVTRKDCFLKGEPALIVDTVTAHSLAEFLGNNDILPFNYLRNVTGTDKIDHFEVAYNLASIPHGKPNLPDEYKTIGLIVVIRDRNKPASPSMIDIWPGADFQEREIFDLVGIEFTGHPDLRRILLDDEFVGHPLKKDYPLIGKWDDMEALEAHLDENQVRKMKEDAGLEFNPDDVPPSFKR